MRDWDDEVSEAGMVNVKILLCSSWYRLPSLGDVRVLGAPNMLVLAEAMRS